MKRPPRILVSGVPGVGKSTLSLLLKEKLRLRYLDVSAAVKKHELWEEYDEERVCTVYDSDAVYDHIESFCKESASRGYVIDFHSVEPMALLKWFDVIIVLHADTNVLWDRLACRGYETGKIQENVECEIMRVIEEDIREEFELEECSEEPEFHEDLSILLDSKTLPPPPVIFSLTNNAVEDTQEILETLERWVAAMN